MSIFLLGGRRLFSSELIRAVRTAGVESPLLSSSTSNTLTALMKPDQLSRLSMKLYSTGKDEKEPDTANVLRDDAFKGLKAGGLLGLLYGVDHFVKGASLKDSVDFGLRSALREGAKGAAVGSVIGAASSNNPEDIARVKGAAKEGLVNGTLTGVAIGGIGVPLAFFAMNNDPKILGAVALVGAILGGCTGAYVGSILATGFAGLSSNHPPAQPAHVDKYLALKNDILSIKEYWMNFMSQHQLGEEHFKEYIHTMNAEEFRMKFEYLQELQEDCISLESNEKLTVSMHNTITDNLRVINNLIEISRPVMEEINESNRFTFRV